MTAGLPNYFEAGTYRTVADPQCANVTTLQNLQTACTLGALADSQNRILLQNPIPGTLGNPRRWLAHRPRQLPIRHEREKENPNQ